MTAFERAQDKYTPEPNSGCWLWTASVDGKGYGQIAKGGKWGGPMRAHRVIYEAVRGPIADGFELDHLCRVPTCVNPYHMEPVTHRENIRRSAPAQRTHCPAGHPYDIQNTHVRRGKRECRACNRERVRAWRSR